MYKYFDRKNIGLILAVLLYRIALDFSYINFVAHDYWGDGFEFTFTVLQCFESWLGLAIILFITPGQYQKSVDFLALLLVIIVYIPLCSYYCYAGGNRLWFWGLTFQVFLFIITLSSVCVIKVIDKSVILRNRNLSRLICTSLLIFLFFKILYEGNWSGLSLSLQPEAIYFRRAEIAKGFEVGVWAYLTSWVIKVVVIYLMIDALERKCYIESISFMAVSLFMYVYFSHKAYLFLPVFAVVLYFLWPKLKGGYWILPAGLICLISITYIYWRFFGADLYVSIFVRRLFFVPAKLNFEYYKFFSQHELIFYSSSFLRGFIEYPYDKAYPYLIGDFSGMGGGDTAANNGFLATGYMQLGWIGVCVYPIIAAILGRLAGALGSRSARFKFAVSFYPFAIMFTSSDLPTALLTHGLALVMLLFWLDDSKSDCTIQQKNR